ncbi:hypothetical protein L3X38_011857 [Prunus dulcis]|uniref:Uncharacterized protein n=1 Tax=Prunus dulcis TaxID=3755 RepID=A0AAD4WIC3_PRUDU|nr:hypothetical protein L3X38_011857 [Prunus dulcis]
MIGMVLELKASMERKKSHETVQFPHLDFGSVELTGRFLLATGLFEIELSAVKEQKGMICRMKYRPSDLEDNNNGTISDEEHSQ